MSLTQPRIAVLIPSRNAERTIGHTIESLNANKEPHDIVIVDDGGATPLRQLIPSQANMTILRLDVNVGITKALNHGIRYILDKGYDYVARMDADDLASPDRLALQIAFMDQNPDIALSGGCGQVVSETGETMFYLNFPSDYEGIRKKLFYNSCFLHPTLMIRAAALREFGLYDETYPNTEDYELIRRYSRFARLANLPQYLIRYTVSAGGQSIAKRKQQLRLRFRVQWQYRDVANIHFYFGILQTCILWLMPVGLLMAIKRSLGSYKQK